MRWNITGFPWNKRGTPAGVPLSSDSSKPCSILYFRGRKGSLIKKQEGETNCCLQGLMCARANILCEGALCLLNFELIILLCFYACQRWGSVFQKKSVFLRNFIYVFLRKITCPFRDKIWLNGVNVLFIRFLNQIWFFLWFLPESTAVFYFCRLRN